MNMTTFNQAFTLATQSQKQKTPRGSIYSITVNNNIGKKQVKCKLHWPIVHNNNQCPIKQGKEAREYLIKKNKCQACCKPKYMHKKCLTHHLYCAHHPGASHHHTVTCDGPDFIHPGSQFENR